MKPVLMFAVVAAACFALALYLHHDVKEVALGLLIGGGLGLGGTFAAKRLGLAPAKNLSGARTSDGIEPGDQEHP